MTIEIRMVIVELFNTELGIIVCVSRREEDRGRRHRKKTEFWKNYV